MRNAVIIIPIIFSVFCLFGGVGMLERVLSSSPVGENPTAIDSHREGHVYEHQPTDIKSIVFHEPNGAPHEVFLHESTVLTISDFGLDPKIDGATVDGEPVEVELISLEEYEASRPKIELLTEVKTNIACPECGIALWKDLTCVYTSFPAQYGVSCKECGWIGTKH